MILYIMGTSGCCNGTQCQTCNEGQTPNCTSDDDCKSSNTTRKESFCNQRITDLGHYTKGYYNAEGTFVMDNKKAENIFESNKLFQPSELSNWIHQENREVNGQIIKKGPVYIYSDIVKKYGRPDVIANQPRGICIWYIEQKDGDIHHSIELRDEYVSHCAPAKHNDFLYSYVKVYIPPEKIKNVLAVSGSVGYDGLQKLLYARCSTIAANMATLASVFLVLNNKDPKYVYQIKNRFASYENNLKYVKEHLRKNQKKYRKQLESSYYDLAFPNGCQ